MLAKIKGLALEVHENPSKDGTKVYRSLIVYEFAQKYPEIRKISLRDDQIIMAQSLVAKMAEVDVGLVIYDGRPTSLFSTGIQRQAPYPFSIRVSSRSPRHRRQ